MTITLALTPTEETRLKAEATRRNLEPTDLLHSYIASLQAPLSGAEALAFWEEQGCLGVFADSLSDSPELARTLRHEAEQRSTKP